MTRSTILAQTEAPAEPEAVKAIVDKGPDDAEKIVEGVTAGIVPTINFLSEKLQALSAQFLSEQGLFQLAVILVAGLIAWYLSKPVRALVERQFPEDDNTGGFQIGAIKTFNRLIFPILWVMALWISVKSYRTIGTGNDLIRILASLLNAWILVHLFSKLVRDPLWSKIFATIAWTTAALYILRLLNPTIVLLDGIAVNFGDARLSVYMMIKGLILLVLLLWTASAVTMFVQSRVSKSKVFTPSMQTLIGQGVRILLLFGAVMLAMNAIGVDLTALAVFSGAVGVGIGFGLQAIFSNLVAGIIMLLERSIKVGDFVELESGLTGEVREINTRSTLISTNDNVDILVPNAEFINHRVINWTLRDGFRRTKIPFGVAYGTDKELVKKAALEAADTLPHMLTGRGAKPPEVWLVEFGESSLNFELVVWLSPEAVKRPSAVAADYNWALETALTKYGIEIPFPQRDIHIRSGKLAK